MDMLPIAVYPSVVDEFLPKVKQDFSKPQLKQFARYLTGLIVCDNKTVSAINDSFVGHNDQSALNNWLTDSDWSDEKLDKARKQLIKEEQRQKRKKRRPHNRRHTQPQDRQTHGRRQHSL